MKLTPQEKEILLILLNKERDSTIELNKLFPNKEYRVVISNLLNKVYEN